MRISHDFRDFDIIEILHRMFFSGAPAGAEGARGRSSIPIHLNHSPPCWMQRHNFSHESEATRVKTSMASIMAESASEFWHRNLVDIPSFTNAFIEKMANDNLLVKVTLTRGYKFFHESYIHDVEGKLPAVSAY